MYSKLAVKNVKKSFSDYAIYFITLTFAVCIFYVFNSISSQQVMMNLSQSQAQYVNILSNVLSTLSVFISIILGFLIIYANNYIIKRRKKELGIYMSLGMDKNKISYMLFLETLIIGIISLGIGLVIGIFLSQGVSVFTAKMFAANLNEFSFVFSKEAAIKTMLYFGVMFIFVILFNSFIISKYKIIDLISADKKNEDLKTKSTAVSVIIFIISVVCLGFAYALIIDNKLYELNREFATSIVLGIVGTLFFFMSLSGFLLKLVQSNKKLYLRNLNMFVLRQINSKINTNYISMSLICLMLFVSIGMLSTGFSMSSSMNSQIHQGTRYDGSFYVEGYDGDISTYLKDDLKFDFNKYLNEYIDFKVYAADTKLKDFLKDVELKDDLVEVIRDRHINVVKESDFNKLMKMIGEEPYKLGEDQYLALAGDSIAKKYVDTSIKNGATITIGNNTLKSVRNESIDKSLTTSPNGAEICTLVVNDNLIKGLHPIVSNMTFSLRDEYKDNESEFVDSINNIVKEYDKEQLQDKNIIKIYVATKQLVKYAYMGLSTLVIYVGLYVGIVFIITCVAVLALQQLSEAADNMKRYKILKNIGVDEKMINKSIFTQTLIYFLMPLTLALVHSVVGIYVSNSVVKIFGSSDIVRQSIIVTALVLLVYGIYFFATYNGAKNMAKKA
ncbi:MAG: FtsX-like permease family protein [Clostridium cadaveris]|uniref:Putative ABC transport system permease protein n=1 Tax=Clostridium cadaveris TaxID=1529 RepID=A0A1I2KJH4_9CLOT|nr:FtsX-like permease family protein [Clostridium cadaveris]MDM8311870.1 FtsX-like permease family protein [Clostridium cadaveris]MDY4949447.1 FtsX-like permease family protein [Clostridium cadaveris]SFF67162.1 putative ABC transport system permease protein [Clostridium cadaveris]